MHKSITTSLTLLLLLTSVATQSTTEWLRLAPAGGGYAVMIPGKAEEQIIDKDQYKASLYTLAYRLGSAPPRVIYLVGAGDYAPTVKVDPAVELPADRDSFIKGLTGMKLIESHNITLDRRPGIELSGESDTATVTARFYVKGNRVYQIAALVMKPANEKENVMKFFDSFAFLD